MKTLLMLCREPRLYSCQRLKTAANSLGYELDILDPNRFLLKLEEGKFYCYYQESEIFDKSRAEPKPLATYAGVLGRFGTLSTEIGCTLLRHFELQGIPTLNSANAFRLARDKWQSLQVLQAAGLPVPTSVMYGELVSSQGVLGQFALPVVLKTLSGSQGVGVMLGETVGSATSMLDTLYAARIPTLVQQFIAEAKGEDIRAFVVGDEVVAAMVRQGREGDFRANIHQGGRAVQIELSDDEKALAVKATKAIGLDVAGVDLIRAQQGLHLLEVNASPGLEMIEQISKVSIAEKMIALLIEKIRHTQ